MSDKSWLLQLHCIDVHANGNIEPLGPPLFKMTQRAGEHPVAEFYNEHVPFHDRQKLLRQEQSQFRMAPANQSLDTEDGSGAHIHLGLKIELEFFGLQGLPDPLQVLMTPPHAAIEHGIEHVKA